MFEASGNELRWEKSDLTFGAAVMFALFGLNRIPVFFIDFVLRLLPRKDGQSLARSHVSSPPSIPGGPQTRSYASDIY